MHCSPDDPFIDFQVFSPCDDCLSNKSNKVGVFKKSSPPRQVRESEATIELSDSDTDSDVIFNGTLGTECCEFDMNDPIEDPSSLPLSTTIKPLPIELSDSDSEAETNTTKEILVNVSHCVN